MTFYLNCHQFLCVKNTLLYNIFQIAKIEITRDIHITHNRHIIIYSRRFLRTNKLIKRKQ